MMRANAVAVVAGLAAILLAAGGAMAVNIETVTVGNAGNAADTAAHSGNSAGQGAVAYDYNIGTYEVTAGQYCEFLNAVAATDTYSLYNTNMWTGTYGCKIQRNGSSGSYTYSLVADYANRPVNYVSWGDSVRFANWLTNGQGNGSTETGAYNLSGAMTDAQLMAVAVPSAAQRAAWSTGSQPYFLLTSEDEWYKAAYHDSSASLAATYFDYPTSSNMVPGYVNDSGNLSTTGTPFLEGGSDPGNYATYDGDGGTDGIGSPYYRSEVGEWENSDSPYGTFDQGGNVWEWNEAVIGSYRGLRGGSFGCSDVGHLHAANRSYDDTTDEYYWFGFRISEVPEPASLGLLTLGGLALLKRRRLYDPPSE